MGLCTYFASPASESLDCSVSSLVGIFIFTNTGSVGPCGYTASCSAAWITLFNPSTTPPNTQLLFSADSNIGAPRNTVITITDNGGGGSFDIPISQSACGCTYSISPTSLSLDASAHPTQMIAVTTVGSGCAWNVTCSDGWVTINTASGTGNGFASISIAANAGAGRNTIVTIGGQQLTISQAGSSCSYLVNPTTVTIGAAGGPLSTSMITTAGCAWTPTGAPPWFTLPGGAGTGSGAIPILVASNTGSTSPRVGTFTVGGQTVNVIQSGGPGGGFAVNDPSEIVCVNGTTRPIMRDRIRRAMGVTPPIDTLPLGVSGEPPMGQPTPTNAEINQAITDAIRWINDRVGFNGSTAVNISVPAYTGVGPQSISLTGVGQGSGTNQNNIDAIQKAVWDPGFGQALIPLLATSQPEQDRLRTNWDNQPASVPYTYLVERNQIGLLPGAQTSGVLQLYCTTAVYNFCDDTDILTALAVDYEGILESYAVLLLSQRRPQEPGAASRIQYLTAQTEQGIQMIGDWYNDSTPQSQRSIGFYDLRRNYGTRRVRR